MIDSLLEIRPVKQHRLYKPADSGCYGAGFHPGTIGKESREVTLRNAKKKINWLAQQLR